MNGFEIDPEDLPTLFQIAIALDTQQRTIEQQAKHIEKLEERQSKHMSLLKLHGDIIADICHHYIEGKKHGSGVA